MSDGGCTCSTLMQTYGAVQYGNCLRDHGNGKGKFCYINLPTTCSDIEASVIDATKQMSWEACKGNSLEVIKCLV